MVQNLDNINLKQKSKNHEAVFAGMTIVKDTHFKVFNSK